MTSQTSRSTAWPPTRRHSLINEWRRREQEGDYLTTATSLFSFCPPWHLCLCCYKSGWLCPLVCAILVYYTLLPLSDFLLTLEQYSEEQHITNHWYPFEQYSEEQHTITNHWYPFKLLWRICFRSLLNVLEMQITIQPMLQWTRKIKA